MVVKKKLRDLTKDEYEKYVDKVCGEISCNDCIFNKAQCVEPSDESSWVNNKELYSDKFLDQEIEIDLPILNTEEKDYLSAVLKPFINNVTDIAKYRRTSDSSEYIVINFKDTEGLILPHFKENTMYKGMELDRKYILAELDLVQKNKNTKITLSDFFNSKEILVIHCDTEEKAKQLLEAFYRLGKEWNNGDSYLEVTNWSMAEKETCYDNKGLYSSYKIYKENDFDIYEFENVDLNN